MKSLFVGNMSFQTTEADLTALFQPFGQIGRIHIVTDRETGRARGFAFVEMPNDAEAGKAMAALDGKEVELTLRRTVAAHFFHEVRVRDLLGSDRVAKGLDDRQRFVRFAELFEHFSNTGELDPAPRERADGVAVRQVEPAARVPPSPVQGGCLVDGRRRAGNRPAPS